mmetsp:Transcript_44027/g.49668  ORF Transcript_44027/g.49668 Transcript_44027/m.49668 type:complete len:121 (+) Transcript_44027:569-931(+)
MADIMAASSVMNWYSVNHNNTPTRKNGPSSNSEGEPDKLRFCTSASPESPTITPLYTNRLSMTAGNNADNFQLQHDVSKYGQNIIIEEKNICNIFRDMFACSAPAQFFTRIKHANSMASL